MKNFTVTTDHIKLLRAAFVGWEDCEYGAPAIDCKRPYGNSDVEQDVAKLLGWTLEGNDGYEPCLSSGQRAAARILHKETRTALQIFLMTGTMQTGLYRRTQAYDERSWKPAT